MKESATPICRPDDKNRRPLCVSLDWLSLRCSRDLFFATEGTNANGYTLTNDVGHGSKNWREIRTIYDPEGVEIGTLTFAPTSPKVDQDMVIVKADNALLYEEGGLERFFAAIIGLNLRFVGISRIDLAADFNEFYGGLLPQNFINGLMRRRYVKCGLNKAFGTIDFGYYATDCHGHAEVMNRKPADLMTPSERRSFEIWLAERNADIEGTGLRPITIEDCRYLDILGGTARVDSLTFGKTGRAIQVQMYNKTKELQEVKMKHYIVAAWKAAGLDISRDVWRVEFRIRAAGKQLENLATGEQFTLSTIDLLTQEQIESLYRVYAEKYWKFYIADNHAKLQNMRRLQLFGFTEKPTARPHRRKVGCPTNYILGLANKVRAIGNEAERVGDDKLQAAATEVTGFFIRAYGLSKEEEVTKAFNAFDNKRTRRLTPELHVDAALHADQPADQILAKVLAKAKAIKAKLLDSPPPLDPPDIIDWELWERQAAANIEALISPVEYYINP